MVGKMTETECHHSYDLDISLQGYTYVHETDTIKTIDSTDYGDDEYNADEPDNIRYPHNYINYPEAGTTAGSTGNNNNNNDEENLTTIMMMKKIIRSILNQYH